MPPVTFGDRRLWLSVLALTQVSLGAAGCSGDLCEDLLVEEQACSGYQKPIGPAGAACTDPRGVYSECVLNSGVDLCKALVTVDAATKHSLESKCGQAPK
jgi:hypothetical protein